MATGTITAIDSRWTKRKAKWTPTKPNGPLWLAHYDYGTETELTTAEMLRQRTTRRRAEVDLLAMDAHGTARLMSCTSAEPHGEPKGKTAEQRGAARYLGVYLSFAG
jgi:hypothetical protein